MEDHRKPLVGSGATSPADLAGQYDPFGEVDGQTRWKLQGQSWYLWQDGNRWVIAPVSGDMPVTPMQWTQIVHWSNAAGPLGDYTPAHVDATGTLTISEL